MTCVCVWAEVVLGEWGMSRVWQGGSMAVCVVSLDSLWRWKVQVSAYCDRRIPAHLRCTQCSILWHLIDICFLTSICRWQISQIQTFYGVVVGPGLVLTSPAYMRSSVSGATWPACSKMVNRAPIAGGGNSSIACRLCGLEPGRINSQLILCNTANAKPINEIPEKHSLERHYAVNKSQGD